MTFPLNPPTPTPTPISMETAVAPCAVIHRLCWRRIFFACFCTWCKENIIKRKVKTSQYEQSNRFWTWLKGQTECREGQQSNFRRLPGGWINQHQPRDPVGVIPRSCTRVQCEFSLTSGLGGSSRVPSGPFKFSFCSHSYFERAAITPS